MPQLKLTALLSLNKTGFDAGMKSAEQSVEKFSHKLVHKFAHAALAAFGIHSLIEFGKEAVRQGVEIDHLAKRFNLTAEEVQLLQDESKRTGISFEELTKDAKELEATLDRIRGGEVLFSDRQVEQLNNLNEIFEAFKTGVAKTLFGFMEQDQLTEDQTRQLEKDAKAKREAKQGAADEKTMLQMEKDIAEAHEKSLPREERLEILRARRTAAFDVLAQMPNVRAIPNLEKTLEIEKLNAEIAALTGEAKTAREPNLQSFPMAAANSLGAIGAFTGGPNQAAHAMGEMTFTLKRIESALIQKGILIRDMVR